MTKVYAYKRLPLIFSFQEKSSYKDTYAGEIGNVSIKAHLLVPEGVQAKTVVIFMHPTGGGSYLPMLNALAKKGIHTVWCDSRYRGTDSALIMEKVVIDLANCIKFLKTKHGYKKVILGGWSGGGSLSLLYQAEAENPSISSTPAGDPLDLTEQGLIPADGLMLIASHISRHRTFTEWLDGSVIDENDPENREAELDIYNLNNINQPPYSEDFLDKYLASQISRNRKITAWVKAKLNQFRSEGDLTKEHAFIVHRTMADPRWLDSSIDPNDRKPNWCFLGDPKVVNNSPIGLGRYCSLRSWLSQWSYDDANGDGIRCAKEITIPTIVIGNTADDGITPSHTNSLFEAIGHEDKEIHWIKGANHYYFGQPGKSLESASLCRNWLKNHDFIDS